MTLTRVDSPTYNETDGLFTAKLELSLPLTRLDLANTLECRVESSALEEPVKSHMQIDLQGKFPIQLFSVHPFFQTFYKL